MLKRNSSAYRNAIATLALSSFLVFCNLYAVQPMLSLFSRHFQVSESIANWIFASGSLGLSCCLIPWAIFADRFGRRIIILTSLALTSLASLMLFFSDSLSMWIALRIFQGIALAGMPAVADPGSSIVRAAHDAGIQVVPLVGPVSLLMTLAASGLNGQNFAFVGYLPQDSAQRVQRIKELEQLALRHNQAQLLIETPYRNPALWQALLQTLQPTTRLVMASGLTLENAHIQSRSVKDWKKLAIEPNNRTPVVFGLGQ